MRLYRATSRTMSGNYLRLDLFKKSVRSNSILWATDGRCPHRWRKWRAEGDRVGVALLTTVVFWLAGQNRSTRRTVYVRSKYCQFYNEMIRRWENIRIFNLGNATHTLPWPVADQKIFDFLLFPRKAIRQGFQSYGLFYSASGTRLKDSVKIVPSSVTQTNTI